MKCLVQLDFNLSVANQSADLWVQGCKTFRSCAVRFSSNDNDDYRRRGYKYSWVLCKLSIIYRNTSIFCPYHLFILVPFRKLRNILNHGIPRPLDQ